MQDLLIILSGKNITHIFQQPLFSNEPPVHAHVNITAKVLLREGEFQQAGFPFFKFPFKNERAQKGGDKI